MSKWYGKIGFADNVEKAPGVFKDEIVERAYYGDIIRNNRRMNNLSDTTNVGITVSNQLSILADPYAHTNFHKMRYAEFMGTTWTITSAEVQYPRITLELGGVYVNGEQA